MFKICDIVEIAEESDSTGMLDFKKGKGYEVEMIQYNFNVDFKGRIERHQEILLRDDNGRTDWYHCTHFKLKEEEVTVENNPVFKIGDTIICTDTSSEGLSAHSLTTGKEYVVKDVWGLYNRNVVVVGDGGEEVGVLGFRFKLKEDSEVENKECLFKGQDVVQCKVFGRGVVESVYTEGDEVHVEFECGLNSRNYTLKGELYSLFPDRVITLSLVKRPFTPTLQAGDVVAAVCKTGYRFSKVVVNEESVEHVESSHGVVFEKELFEFYRLGEKINFK